MVGVWKYGHGKWEDMREDDSLGFKDKFFIEDAKIKQTDTVKRRIPNSIHLVRRADYLTHLLREYYISTHPDQTAPSKQHRPIPRVKASVDREGSSSAPKVSKAPKVPKASSSKPSAAKTSSKPVASSSKATTKRKAAPEYSSSEASDSEYDSMDEVEDGHEFDGPRGEARSPQGDFVFYRIEDRSRRWIRKDVDCEGEETKASL